jgi:hypothetical protein
VTLAAHALTTVAAVEDVVGDGVFPPARIEQQIHAVTARFERYCGRRFAVAEHTQRLPGTGRWFLCLRHYPILSVANVEIDGQAITDYQMTDEAVQGLLYRAATWPVRRARHADLTWDPDSNSDAPNIRVTYQAGYILSGEGRTLPHDLEQACIDLVVHRLLHPVQGLQQERTPGGHTTVWHEGLPPEIRSVLASYRGGIR